MRVTERWIVSTFVLGFALIGAPAHAGGSNVTIERVPERGRLSGSADIDHRVGGILRVGRWTVAVPPGALPRSATITLVVPDASKMLCELEISPASCNQFLLPVTLSARGNGGSVEDTEGQLFLFDPSTGTWDNVTTASDPARALVIAALWHFSDYAEGKAGW